MSNRYSQQLERDGVTLIRNCIDESLMAQIRTEYDYLDETLLRTEIELEKPIIVFWRHVIGDRKRLSNFEEFPSLWKLITEVVTPVLRSTFAERCNKLQLLETIIFNKPAKISNTLNWHQDVASFPLKPNNQLAVWIPFEIVTREKSAMVYALGSHKHGVMGSTDLHTREVFANDDRPLIPEDPASAGFEVKCMEMGPDDMLVHDGHTWHHTEPNTVDGFNRRGLSVRFIVEEAVFDPRPGQGAAFTKQIEVSPGDIVKGLAFPDL